MRHGPAQIPFRFELPIEVWEKAGPDPTKRRRIGGIISTESTDRQGEKVLQRGLDFSEFLSNGWFNDNHSKDTTGIVGYPELVKRIRHNGRDAHYVEGYLIAGHKPADEIWELSRALQNTGRKLGFSIEGAVLRRDGADGRTIAEAKVRNVAITNCPVNVDTGLQVLAKSMLAMESESDADALVRGLTAGSAIVTPAAPVAGDGFALRAVSLERAPKTTTYSKRRRKKKLLSKSEAIDLVCLRYPGLSRIQADRIVGFAVEQAARFNAAATAGRHDR